MLIVTAGHMKNGLQILVYLPEQVVAPHLVD